MLGNVCLFIASRMEFSRSGMFDITRIRTCFFAAPVICSANSYMNCISLFLEQTRSMFFLAFLIISVALLVIFSRSGSRTKWGFSSTSRLGVRAKRFKTISFLVFNADTFSRAVSSSFLIRMERASSTGVALILVGFPNNLSVNPIFSSFGSIL